MVQVDAVAAEQSPDFSECGFLAIDIVGWGIVFVGSPGNTEFAVGDDFVVISFLTQRGGGVEEGQKTHRSLEQNSSGETQNISHVQILIWINWDEQSTYYI